MTTAREIGLPFRFVGTPVQVAFPTANARTEVLHQCGEVPHGVLAIFATGAITAEPGEAWTKDLAFLRCTMADPNAVLCFVVLKEEPRNVSPT